MTVFLWGGTQDARLKAGRYSGEEVRDSPFAKGALSGHPGENPTTHMQHRHVGQRNREHKRTQKPRGTG
jgi:hypothetical protein